MQGKIQCLECGKWYYKPLSHVWQKHNMLEREYKTKHGLDLKKGIIDEKQRDLLRKKVVENGTILNLQKGVKTRFTSDTVPKYTRSKQTLERLKKNWKIHAKRTGRDKMAKITITCAYCGTEKEIYPRYKKDQNYCSITCSNKSRIKSKSTNL